MFLNLQNRFVVSITGVLCASLLWTSCRKDSVSPMTTPSTITIKDTLVPNIAPPNNVVTTDNLSAQDTLENGHLLLGNPTLAAHTKDSVKNYLISTGYYVTSYNSQKAIPNWVSWHLAQSDLGSVSRSDAFTNYPFLPTGWYQVQAGSYQGSATGFDRGHNCPSGDRTSTSAANNATFYMINMIPQSPALNQGPWEGMESTVRGLLGSVAGGMEAYIIMGNYGTGGSGSKGGTTNVIPDGSNSITVPSHVWKVAIVLPSGSNDLTRIDANTTVIAVDMPNTNSLYSTSNKGAWNNYITTISAIEAASKAAGQPLNLLSRLNTTVQAALKSKKYSG